MARVSSFTAILALLFISLSCAPAADFDGPAESAPSIVGSWRLDSWTVGDGMPRCTEEEGGASGQIMYSHDGHMSAQLGCARIPVGDLGAAEAAQAVAQMSRRHFSYYGSYSLDMAKQTVTHHVMGSSSPAWVDTERVRSFTFEGPDRIILTTENEDRLAWLRN